MLSIVLLQSVCQFINLFGFQLNYSFKSKVQCTLELNQSFHTRESDIHFDTQVTLLKLRCSRHSLCSDFALRRCLESWTEPHWTTATTAGGDAIAAVRQEEIEVK